MIGTSTGDLVDGFSRALHCCIPGHGYEALPHDAHEQVTYLPNSDGWLLSAPCEGQQRLVNGPVTCTMGRHDWTPGEIELRVSRQEILPGGPTEPSVLPASQYEAHHAEQVRLGFRAEKPAATPSSHVSEVSHVLPPTMSRAELEARVNEVRLAQEVGTPFTQHKLDYDDPNLCRHSGKRTIDEAFVAVKRAVRQHVDQHDSQPLTLRRLWYNGYWEALTSYLPDQVRRGFDKIWHGDAFVEFHKLFSADGDADLEMTKSDKLRVVTERQFWHAALMRSYTLHASGASASNVPLHGFDALVPSSLNMRVDRSTRFLELAKDYKMTTAQQEAWNVSPTSHSTHPTLAAHRHLETVALTKVIMTAGMVRRDPDISAASRDKQACGARKVITHKDLGHLGPATSPDHDVIKNKLNGAEPKYVNTLMDDITYRTSLRPFAGEDIVVTTSLYDCLSGETPESTWRCTGVDENGYALFTETIGGKHTSGVFENQYSWDFGNNDVVHIPNKAGTGYGIYDVVKCCRRDINRQTVFLCMRSWVNMPFEVADRLNYAAHGVYLHDLHQEPGPCKNVQVVGQFTKHPVLVMRVAKGKQHYVYTRYQHETSAGGTATVTPPVLRHLELLHSHGGKAQGLTSREILQRLGLLMKDFLPGGTVDAPDCTSLLELFKVLGVPEERGRPNIVYYEAENFVRDNMGAEEPEEDRTAKAVQQAPSIVTGTATYGVIASNEPALEKGVEEHLGEGNTKKRGPHMAKFAEFCQREFIKGLEEHSGCRPGSVLIPPREKVLEKRTRPSQRANEVTWGVGECPGDTVGHGFIKGSEVSKQKRAPRMIQSPPHDLSIKSGQLGKALETILKASESSHGVAWYCPGLNPRQLGEALASQHEFSKLMAREFGAGPMPQVDYKSADDSHTEESATLVADIIRHFFSDEHDPDLGMSHKAWALQTYYECFNFLVKVGHKVKSTKWKNASGTGITTLLNTLVFAFRSYMTILLALFFKQMIDEDGEVSGMPQNNGESDAKAAGDADWFTKDMFREQLKKLQNQGVLHHAISQYDTVDWDACQNRLRVNATQRSPVMRLIFELIGLKFGDDGVECSVPGVSEYFWELACKYLDASDGFQRTICFSHFANGGPHDPDEDESVEFLSREYPRLSATIASYCKIERAAEKLSISSNADDDKYRNKLFGYMITDRRTPIIGAYISAIWAFKNFGELPAPYDPETDTYLVDQKYIDKVEVRDREVAWKMREGPFPVTDVDLDYMYESVAATYGMSSGELRALDESLRVQTTWEGIKAHKLPPALAILTPDDPTGDQLERRLPAGTAMVTAFPNEGKLYNAMPDTARQRSRDVLATLVGAPESFDKAN